MEATVMDSGMWVPSSGLVLVLVLAGLATLAGLQIRDMVAYWKAPSRAKPATNRVAVRLPAEERLSLLTRWMDALQLLRRDHREIRQAVDSLAEDRQSYSDRVRREIDRMVGRDEYQGKKEQL